MPAVKLEKINNNAWWCLWEITESLAQMERNVLLSEQGKEELQEIKHPTKKLESLASRRCIQEIMKFIGKDYHGIYKDEHSKPHLIDSNYQISISHSFPYATGILHKKLKVGIDLEKPVEKLTNVANRFLNDEEFIHADGNLKALAIYWSGKEAIYKLNGRYGLSFREDIKIYPFPVRKRDTIRSEMLIESKPVRISLHYRELYGYYITFCF